MPAWLAALLGAAVMAAVMASDSQILALSTMFTEDVFAFYGGKRRFGEAAQVQTGRAFVVTSPPGLRHRAARRNRSSTWPPSTRLRVRGAVAALRGGALLARSTKWGALASTVWVAAAVLAVAIVQTVVPGQRRERVRRR